MNTPSKKRPETTSPILGRLSVGLRLCAMSWVGLAAALIGTHASTQAAQAGSGSLDVVTLAPGILLVRPDTPIGNPTTVALVGDEETWLLDAGIPESAAAIDSMLVSRGALRVTRVITSHAHRDHTDGLVHWVPAGAFGMATPEQIGTIEASPVIVDALEDGLDVLPREKVEDEVRLTLRMRKEDVDVHVFRPRVRSGHTDGDLLVHLPEAGILYVGDYYFADRFPIVDTDGGGSLDGYVATLDWIAEEFASDTRVIPGHNTFAPAPPEVPTMEAFVAWRDEIRNSIEWIGTRLRDGLEPDSLAAAGLPEEFAGLSERPRYVPEERWIRFVVEAIAGDMGAAETTPSVADAPSPSGTLLFTTQRSRQDDLYLLHLPDFRIERLTDHRAKDSHGKASPADGRIVFNSERVGWWKIWVMNGDGTEVRQLTRPDSGADYYPTWSPDGTRIAFASGTEGNGDILTMAVDGSEPVNLTDHPARDNFPAWSPDGSTIAYASDRSGQWAVHLVGADGAGDRQVTNEGNALEPEWFPNGRRIAFQSTNGNEDGNFDLWTLDLETGAATRLTEGPFDDERPAVSPDGRWIAFESDRAGGSQLFLIPADGGEIRQMTSDGYCYGPSWVPVER